MVRTPPGTFPLTDFTGREQSYDDDKFIPAPVKKGVFKIFRIYLCLLIMKEFLSQPLDTVYVCYY